MKSPQTKARLLHLRLLRDSAHTIYKYHCESRKGLRSYIISNSLDEVFNSIINTHYDNQEINLELFKATDDSLIVFINEDKWIILQGIRTTNSKKSHNVRARSGGALPLEDVIGYIRGQCPPRHEFSGQMVRVGERRLKVFKNNPKCALCKLKATHFYVEKLDKNSDWKLGMYGLDTYGDEVLFTIDHIIPKNFGGSDDISNLQTMCMPCNQKKSDFYLQDLALES